MTKFSSILLCLLAGTGSFVFGQGTVDFGNTPTSRISTNSVSGGPSTGLMSANSVHFYYFALFVAPSTQNTADATLSGWTFTGNYATNIVLIGRLNGNYNLIVSSVTVPGFATLSTADFVVLGWDSNLGKDVNVVLSYWANGAGTGPLPAGFSDDHTAIGLSGVANDLPLGGGAIPPLRVLETGLTLSYFPVLIPEPSVLGLVGLFAALTAISRRRKVL
jgi:hypothetical protein